MAEDGKRVLVVTDDEPIRRGMEFAFSSDVAVSSARDARDAWNFLEDGTPDLVIVDIQSGSSGGFALTRDMRADSRLKNVPVLMILERDQDEWLAKTAGANAVMTKPVDRGRLMATASPLLS